MRAPLVGDRFVRLESGDWRDLATGRLVSSPTTVQDDSPTTARVRRHAEDIVNRALAESSEGTRLVGITLADDDRPDLLAGELASRLRVAGFVTVGADVDVPDDVRRYLEHRHLCLLAFDEPGRAFVTRWLRDLGRVSARGHLVLVFQSSGEGERSVAPVIARESAPVRSDPPVSPPIYRHAFDDRLARARRLERRGRYAGAGRWYRAALESARRRGDERAAALGCRQFVDWLRRRDDWDEADRVTRHALDGLRDTAMRLDVAVVRAEVLLARAEFGEAEAVLAGVAAEAAVEDRSVPVGLQAVRAELGFWQGRIDEVLSKLVDMPPSPGGLMTQGLIGWLRRDVALVDWSVEALASVPSSSTLVRRATLSMLQAALTGDASRVIEAATAAAHARTVLGCPHLDRLSRALTAEAMAFVGVASSRGVVMPSADERAPALDRWLCEWQAACQARNHARERKAAANLGRAGVGVVRIWRWGCPDMYLIQSIPILLQLVQDAEDELSALAAAGSWIRREAGGEAVAFLDGDRAVVSADGWTAADTQDVAGDLPSETAAQAIPTRAGDLLVVAGIRYAGTRTGFVAIRGPERRRRALCEAAETTAALCGPALRARIDTLTGMRAASSLTSEILGRSPAMASLRETILRAAATPFAVLIEGESGTGKELVARAIHRLSPRRDRRFSAVNAAALTDELVEAELFGHARGAFTGAVAPRAGLFEDAHGGSLFLDEVSELSMRAQAKLLRVLQEREVRRVGENTVRPVDVRVIAATNQSLAEAVTRAAFREDLLFRLAVVKFRLPPLRDRIEDVPLLAHASWRVLLQQTGKRTVLGPDAVARLCRHEWPGNVRELQNAMAALLIVAPDRGRVGARHVNEVLAGSAVDLPGRPLPLERMRANCERTAVLGALVRNGGRRSLAARDLGLTRQGLTKAMKRLGLDDASAESGVA